MMSFQPITPTDQGDFMSQTHKIKLIIVTGFEFILEANGR